MELGETEAIAGPLDFREKEIVGMVGEPVWRFHRLVMGFKKLLEGHQRSCSFSLVCGCFGVRRIKDI